jgi:hypothetical protein
MEQVEAAVKAFAVAEVQRVLELLAADYDLDPHELTYRYCAVRTKSGGSQGAARMARRKIAGTADDVHMRFREVVVEGRHLLLDEDSRQLFTRPDGHSPGRVLVGLLLADGTVVPSSTPKQDDKDSPRAL